MTQADIAARFLDMAHTEQANRKAGDRLHFRPTPERAPFGTAIPEGDVEIVEVVDHGSATPYSPRFTYVVRALDGSGTQGTDDRELTEIEPAAEAPKAPTAAQLFNQMMKIDRQVGVLELQIVNALDHGAHAVANRARAMIARRRARRAELAAQWNAMRGVTE